MSSYFKSHYSVCWVSQITLKNVNNSHILHKNDFELLQLRKKINGNNLIGCSQQR